MELRRFSFIWIFWGKVCCTCVGALLFYIHFDMNSEKSCERVYVTRQNASEKEWDLVVYGDTLFLCIYIAYAMLCILYINSYIKFYCHKVYRLQTNSKNRWITSTLNLKHGKSKSYKPNTEHTKSFMQTKKYTLNDDENK